MLQTGVSVVNEGSFMDITAEMDVETLNRPSINDSYSARKGPWPSSRDCSECGKSYVLKRNLVRRRKQHHSMDNGPRLPCPQCYKKFFITVSGDLHC